ncbi:hypothetical protein ACFW04_014404 [Cataglyphis niger]
MSYRATQVFTGHRQDDVRCYHCNGDEDAAQHTLEVCPAWAGERRVLVQKIGKTDFSISSIAAARLEGEESWRAVSSFYEAVMLQKKRAERGRDAPADDGNLPVRRAPWPVGGGSAGDPQAGPVAPRNRPDAGRGKRRRRDTRARLYPTSPSPALGPS